MKELEKWAEEKVRQEHEEEKLIDLMARIYGCDPMYYGVDAHYLAKHLIANDVVQVVRCKDCKHYDNREGIQWCHLNSKFGKFAMDWHSFPEDGYCSYGERREGE